MISIQKLTPSTRDQRPLTPDLLNYSHLSGDFVGGQKVISVEPLNVVSPAEAERLVSSGRRPVVCLCKHSDCMRFKLPGNLQGSVFRTVVDDDNLLACPRLQDGRTQSLANPLLGVVCRNENRNKRFH